jgi:hypothetical protein
MSVALADLLIELADPGKLGEFNREPEAVMETAGLTQTDKFALRSKIGGLIRYQVQNDLQDPAELEGIRKDFVIAALALDVIDVITATDVIVVA